MRSSAPTRRIVIGSLAAGAAGVATTALDTPARAEVSRPANQTSGPLPPVSALPAGAPDRQAFAPEEQRLAYYLVTLADIANDVDDSDTELRGFIHGGWWRSPDAPFNARISEMVSVFAWFAASERSWNPYTGDPALVARTDAAIGYYLTLQHEDGSWPEYSATEHSRAATAFALGYLSKTLDLLRSADLLPGRRPQITDALRAAMRWFLDPGNGEIWQDELVEFVNQPLAGVSGAARALSLDPDAGLEALLTDRIEFIADHGQSPAGFLYEPRGMDIAYNLNVALTEIIEIHRETGRPSLLPMVHRLADWFGYVNVPEPDGSGLVSFASGAARIPMYYLDAVTTDFQQRDVGSVLSRQVPDLASFYTTAEERDRIRAEWAASPEPVPPFEPGRANPRILANVAYGEHYPREQVKAAAWRRIPAVRSQRFTELRTDPMDQHYLFVRRPASYLMAFFGTRPNSVVRAGFGLLWHPEAGVLIQGGQSSNTECWATVLPNGGTDGASNLTPTWYDGPVADGGVLADPTGLETDLGVRWTTTGGNVTGEALISDAEIVREISATMDAVEQVPLVLLPTDGVRFSDGSTLTHGEPAEATATSVTITRDAVVLTIDWGDATAVTVQPTARTLFADARRRVHMLRIPHGTAGRVRYTLM
ncbi:hypothetical protein [Ruania alba]|uniref:Uncharacterized protein n=1 Tax=Ruania alba TaxID=648782 RepID=A0A1H5MCP7_9MICO|nr:hypothetical protein [Ruania alba]SEE86218.1 hypothetical protein SAMN04488554_3247 [Ruania alba]